MSKITEVFEVVFKTYHDFLRKQVEEEKMMCLTNEAWQGILEDKFNGNLVSWINSMLVAVGASPRTTTTTESIYTPSNSDYFTIDDIKLGTNNSYEISEKNNIRSFSPALIPDFWINSNNEYEFDDIRKLLVAFNPGTVERRVFNEVHCYKSDENITIGFGHWATGNIEGFFMKMPGEIWADMRNCMKACINANKNIVTGHRNINFYKTFKEQFWEDYQVVCKKKVDDKNEYVDDNHLDDYFRRNDCAMRKRCEDVYSKRETLYVNNNKEISLWGDGDVKKRAILLSRCAMKDAYYNKAKMNLICAKQKKEVDFTLESLEDGNIKFTEDDFKGDCPEFKNLEELRNYLSDDSKKIDPNIYVVLQELLFKAMEIFNNRLKEINEKSEATFGISLTESKDKVDKIGFEGVKKENSSTLLGPFPGNKDESGYWFYDIVRQALCLKSVCYYQLAYFVDCTIESDSKYKTNAAVAAATSWGSSRFNRKLEEGEYTKKYLFVDKNYKRSCEIDVKNDEKSQAFMLWHNYNALRAESEAKKLEKLEKPKEYIDQKIKEIRSRNIAIWKIWFGNSKMILPNAKPDDYSSNIKIDVSGGNKFNDSVGNYIEFLKSKEKKLKAFVRKKK